jgi:hypothetical protein
MDRMGDFHPTCPKCNEFMDRGHIPDYAHGDVMALQTVWSPGDPVPRRFQTGIKADRDAQIPVTAYRCAACGFVELYARPG